MKRYRKNIFTATDIEDSQQLFTPKEVAELLSEIKELKNCKVSIKRTPDNELEYIVGDSAYQIL